MPMFMKKSNILYLAWILWIIQYSCVKTSSIVSRILLIDGPAIYCGCIRLQIDRLSWKQNKFFKNPPFCIRFVKHMLIDFRLQCTQFFYFWQLHPYIETGAIRQNQLSWQPFGYFKWKRSKLFKFTLSWSICDPHRNFL